MQHQLMPGREIGVYWVEHVLRHGGKHLHSVSKNLPFYQHHLLDVWLFLIFTSMTTFFGIFKLTTCLARKTVKFRKEKTQWDIRVASDWDATEALDTDSSAKPQTANRLLVKHFKEKLIIPVKQKLTNRWFLELFNMFGFLYLYICTLA